MPQEKQGIYNQSRALISRQIYDLLSELLQDFTFFFVSAQKIMIHHLKFEFVPKQKLLQEVSVRINPQTYLKRLNQLLPDTSSTISCIFRRFAARIDEMIFPVKRTFIPKSSDSAILLQQMNRIQSAVHSFRIDNRIDLLIDEVCQSFENFIENIKKEDNYEHLLALPAHLEVQSPQKFDTESNKKARENSTVSSYSSNSIPKFNKLVKSVRQSSSISNILGIADLDTNYYISLPAQSNTYYFFDHCLCRNRKIKSAIETYSQSYDKYLMTRLRKNNTIIRSSSFKRRIKQKKMEIKTERGNRSLSIGQKKMKTETKVQSLKKPQKFRHLKTNYPPFLHPNKVSQFHIVTKRQDSQDSARIKEISKSQFALNNLLKKSSKLPVEQIISPSQNIYRNTILGLKTKKKANKFVLEEVELPKPTFFL